MFIKEELYEYDISKCNINVSITFNLINKETYDKLNSLSKFNREVQFGLMLRDKVIDSEKFNNAIKTTVKHFIKINNLSKDDIDEIAKDAVWIHRRVLNTKLNDYIEFKLKSEATSMFIYKRIKFYYNSRTGNIFQRGLGAKGSPLYDVIAQAMQIKENGGVENLYNFLHSFKLDYLNKKLADEYYVKLTNEDNVEIINTLIDDLIN